MFSFDEINLIIESLDSEVAAHSQIIRQLEDLSLKPTMGLGGAALFHKLAGAAKEKIAETKNKKEQLTLLLAKVIQIKQQLSKAPRSQPTPDSMPLCDQCGAVASQMSAKSGEGVVCLCGKCMASGL